MKYRKKPIEVEAIQFIIEFPQLDKLREFAGDNIDYQWIHEGEISVKTLEGNMRAYEEDYIIKGIKGEFYPCNKDIFELTYEKI